MDGRMMEWLGPDTSALSQPRADGKRERAAMTARQMHACAVSGGATVLKMGVQIHALCSRKHFFDSIFAYLGDMKQDNAIFIIVIETSKRLPAANEIRLHDSGLCDY
jgi:hypothetical protein